MYLLVILLNTLVLILQYIFFPQNNSSIITFIINNRIYIFSKPVIFYRRYFATVFAVSYAIFLVIFGAIVFVGNAVVDQYPIPEVLYSAFFDHYAITFKICFFHN